MLTNFAIGTLASGCNSLKQNVFAASAVCGRQSMRGMLGRFGGYELGVAYR